MPDDWALVVGINQYPHAVGVTPLEGAVHDAQAFHDWVTHPLGGAVCPDRAKLIVGPAEAPSEPPKIGRPYFSDLSSFIEEMQAQVSPGDGRRLYIYLSGHGISPAGQESVRNAALVLANARPPNWPNFAGNIWAEGARSSALFEQVVLIMDCCRDLKNNAPVITHFFGEPVSDAKQGLLAELYATRWDSQARELQFPPEARKQGVFTRSLLAVLKTGRMSGRMLKESVRQHLADALSDQRRAQEPEIGSDDDLAKIVFNEAAPPPRTKVVLNSHPATRPNIRTWPEGAARSVKVELPDWTYDGSIWHGTLEPGYYQLRLADHDLRLDVFAGVKKELVV